MPHVISCPHCHDQVSIPEHFLGQTVRCPRCGGTFQVTAEMVGGGESFIEAPRAVPASPIEPEPAAGRPSPADAYPDEGAFESPHAAPGARALPSGMRPHRGPVILVLGILSIVLGCVGLILGPIAWIMGSNDLQEMRVGRMDPEGEALTNAGRICGIIGTIVHAFGCCCGGVYLGMRLR